MIEPYIYADPTKIKQPIKQYNKTNRTYNSAKMDKEQSYLTDDLREQLYQSVFLKDYKMELWHL